MNTHQERYNFVAQRLAILHYIDAEFPTGRVNFTAVGNHFNVSRDTIRRIYSQRHNIERLPRGRPPTTPVAPAPVARPPYPAEEENLGVAVAALFNPRLPHQPDALLTIEGYIDRTLDISMYVISCRPLIDAVVRAARRGVVIRIFIDLEQAQASPQGYRDFIATNLIQIKHRGTQYQDIHDNFVIVDGEIVLIGSASWSVEAFNGLNFL